MSRPSRRIVATSPVLTKFSLAQIASSNGKSASSLVDRIFTLVSDAIRDGRLTTGTRLPSVRQLAEDCGISRDTAVRAYDKLVAHGTLESRRSSGYYVKQSTSVRASTPAGAARASANAWGSLSSLHRLRYTMIQDPPSLLSRSGSGNLPGSWIDEERIARAFRSISKHAHRTLSNPGDSQGYLPLREQLQIKLRDIGVHTEASNIIVTSGAGDALSLITQYYLPWPGEPVLVERPCQPLIVDRLMSCGLAVETVPRLADGPDLEVMRQLCEKLRPKMFFCSSVLHNPTSNHLAPHKAFQLLRLAEEFDMTIVEDDSYGDLLPSSLSAAVSRLAPLDQLNRVIYVGSFSKTLAAGLRVGYLAARADRIEWLNVYRLISTMASNSFSERVVHQLLSEGEYRHHCEQLQVRLDEVRPRVATEAKRLGLSIDHEPNAGMFLWADLGPGIDSFVVAQKLLAKGHLVAPGALFHDYKSSRVRLNLATSLDDGALEALARTVQSA